jgi:PTS system nitrogen regulatory IIA component
MDLRDIIEPANVFLLPKAADKEQLLGDLAQRAAAALDKDVESILAPLRAREALGSTGLGQGFALPHARVEGLDRLFCLFARVAKPVAFDAIDERPIDLVCLLLIPPDDSANNLKALAVISRSLRDKALIEHLRAAKTREVLAELLRSHIC